MDDLSLLLENPPSGSLAHFIVVVIEPYEPIRVRVVNHLTSIGIVAVAFPDKMEAVYSACATFKPKMCLIQIARKEGYDGPAIIQEVKKRFPHILVTAIVY